MQILTDLLKASANRTWVTKDIALAEDVMNACSIIPESIKNVRPSHVAFVNVMKWHGTPENALASALIAMNADHAPFTGAYKLIDLFFKIGVDSYKEYVNVLIKNRQALPGYGNPIFKESDPRLEIIQLPEEYKQLGQLTKNIINKPTVNPNLVFYVSAVSHHLGLPETHASILFLIPTFLTYLNLWQRP